MELTPVCRETVLPATAESAKRGLWDGMNYSNLLRRNRKPAAGNYFLDTNTARTDVAGSRTIGHDNCNI
jgi:hypothetical protein